MQADGHELKPRVLSIRRETLEPFPFRFDRNGAHFLVLTRFLHANRGPLRWKTLWRPKPGDASGRHAPDAIKQPYPRDFPAARRLFGAKLADGAEPVLHF